MKKKFVLKHKIYKSFKDNRGYINNLLKDGYSSCLEIFSKKKTIRANHYHIKDEHFIYVLSGKILWFYRDRKKNAKLNYKIMNSGDLFFTTYKQDHMAYFLKNTHFLAFSTRKRTKFNYEKDLVRLNMDKEKKIKKIISKHLNT